MLKLGDLIAAYKRCRKNKRGSKSALEFEIDFCAEIVELYNQLIAGTYVPASHIGFVVLKPKPREIFAAQFRDRILHHYIDMKIRPLIEEILIPETCNNRKGKGTESAIQYVYDFLQHACNDDHICKIDMRGFFMSISKTLITNLILEFIRESYYAPDKDTILWLIEIILLNDPTENCIIQSQKWMWDYVPKNKSLFQLDRDLGLPIGNLLSQLLANFLLNEFDHFCKNNFKYYVRYVDDCIIIDSKENILKMMPILREELSKVGIELHPDKFYLQHYTKGVKFVGANIFKDRLYVHNRTVYNALQKISSFQHVSYQDVIDLQMTMNSYLGLMKYRQSYNIRKELMFSIDESYWNYFYTEKGFHKISLRKIFKQKYTIHDTTTNKSEGIPNIGNEVITYYN